ncbi:MAG: metal-binding protein [Rhodobacteraceae bacterium GWE1_64_9]|nr:MAG: metal-binding protein [Rhodobacteraceae bacterium GWE1_64_9]OHC47837.1 MAG: metal-binding protein [Rhodobacteraceae bacterium GWF1_65_7]
MTLTRRHVLSGAASLISLGILPAQAFAQELETIEVFKTATCGCCHDWIAHLQDAGFAVAAQDLEYVALAELKQTAGVPDALVSCHTGRIAGYVIEGHVPAADIRRLLVERPDAIGLSVPGMPIGSPGMGPEDQREAYDVILIGRDGAANVFASYPAA